MKQLEKREVEQTRSEDVANVGEEGKSTERRGSDDAEDEDDHEMDVDDDDKQRGLAIRNRD